MGPRGEGPAPGGEKGRLLRTPNAGAGPLWTDARAGQPACPDPPSLSASRSLAWLAPPSISHDASRMRGRCEPPSTKGWCRGAALALWCGAHSWDMVILGEAVDARPQSRLCCGPLRGLEAPRLPLHTPGERGDPAPSPLPASASRPLPPLLCAAAGEPRPLFDEIQPQTAHAGG